MVYAAHNISNIVGWIYMKKKARNQDYNYASNIYYGFIGETESKNASLHMF